MITNRVSIVSFVLWNSLNIPAEETPNYSERLVFETASCSSDCDSIIALPVFKMIHKVSSMYSLYLFKVFGVTSRGLYVLRVLLVDVNDCNVVWSSLHSVLIKVKVKVIKLSSAKFSAEETRNFSPAV